MGRSGIAVAKARYQKGKAGPKSKTGDAACSQAVSDWKTHGMTAVIAAILGKCHAHGHAGASTAIAEHKAAGSPKPRATGKGGKPVGASGAKATPGGPATPRSVAVAKARRAGAGATTPAAKGATTGHAAMRAGAARAAATDDHGKPIRPGKDKSTDAAGGTLDKRRRQYANAQEQHVSDSLGGTWLKDYEPMDAVAPKASGSGSHAVEVKSMIFGDKRAISVHPNALVRKAEHAEANKRDTFHTVVLDKRGVSEGGAHADRYSGHDLYYKRACGPYSLSKMYKCKDMAEVKRLMETPTHRLPEAARGEFPKGAALDALRARAIEEKAYNDARSVNRKAREKALGIDTYKRKG